MGPQVLCCDRATASLPWLKAALAELNSALYVVSHGEAALDRIGESLPDLVLLGFHLPGLDGLEVCRRIAFETRTAGVPVLMVSTVGRGVGASGVDLRGRDEVRASAFDAGAVGCLFPPDARAALLSQLRSALRVGAVARAAERRATKVSQLAATRDALSGVSLADLEVMIRSASRALELVRGGVASRADYPADDRRALRVAQEELTTAGETLSCLQTVRAVDSGEWDFSPATIDAATLVEQGLEAAGDRVAVNATVEPNLRLAVDAELVQRALTAMVLYLSSRAAHEAEAELTAEARSGGGVRFAVSVTGDVPPVQPTTPLTQVLELTLAQLVAEGHGGSLQSVSKPRPGFVLELPGEPISGAWPPHGLFNRATREADDNVDSPGTEAADWLAKRTTLPAPPQPLRLKPPANND